MIVLLATPHRTACCPRCGRALWPVQVAGASVPRWYCVPCRALIPRAGGRPPVGAS
jgi:hypothetical protein